MGGRSQHKAVFHALSLVNQLQRKVNIFRLILFDWWAGFDLASIKLTYLPESGMAREEAFD
jgi:hypothetical protein